MEVKADGFREKEVFEMVQTPLFYTREHGSYLQEPILKRLRRTNVLDRAICFWYNGLQFNSMFARAFYDALGDTKSMHLA